MYVGCLFGYGRAGKIHFKNIINSSILLKYIYDIDERIDIIRKDISINYPQSGVLVTSDLNKILKDDAVNISIICTPTDNHYQFIKDSLNNGMHVLCEKPLAKTEDEIKNCYSLADRKKLILLCALNRRFDPDINNIRNNINSVGRINSVLSISRDHPYPTYEYLKISSGIFHDCGIHDIDFINWILNDKPISVYATGNKIFKNNINAGELDNAIIMMEYSNGIIANINLSRISESYDQRLEIHGTNGILRRVNPITMTPISFPELYEQSYKNELHHFLAVIDGRERIAVTENDCIDGFKILQACDESFKSSKKITVKYSDGFRDYSNVTRNIRETYKKARINQTVDYVDKMHEKYLKFNRKMKITEIFDNLDSFIDVSDPDISLPNSHHAYQTADGIRKDGHPEWLQVVGLIHDIGKIIYLRGSDEDGTSIKEQWGIVGDTFIVGCKLPDTLNFPEFNDENPDTKCEKYNSKLGMYTENCGLYNVKCSWGHDEYLYQILKYNQVNLPEEALYIIRYHSLYPYHDKGEYKHFTNQKDAEMFKWLKIFNKYDLYTKSDDISIDKNYKKYYNGLINKYLNKGELWI